MQFTRLLSWPRLRRVALCALCWGACGAVLAQQCLVRDTSPTVPVRKLFVVAGQSNAAGLASVRDIVGGVDDYARQDTVFPNVKIYGIYGAPQGVTGRDDGRLSRGVQWSRFASWQLARPGFGFKNFKQYTNDFPADVTAQEIFGPELYLARYLNDYFPLDSYIVKLAVANTSLHNAGGLDNWAPSGHLNNELLKMIASAYNTQRSKVRLQVSGLFWMQGETDALNKTSALQYKKNLSGFIKKFRQSLVRMQCASDVDVPVVVGRIQDNPVWVYRSHVRLAQAQVAHELPRVSLVDTDDLSAHLVVGGVHFNEVAQARLGGRAFKAFIAGADNAKKE